MHLLSGPRVFGAIFAFVLIVAAMSAGSATAGGKKPPKLASPSSGVALESLPAFAWKKVRGAAKYEFQLSADRQFESIVLGQGRGSFQTRNQFATLDQTLPNGEYYWRVRSINKKEKVGRWSQTRRLRKNWNTAPALIEPVRGEAISYPQTPLVLRWNPVPRAYKYLLWIGTDPSLASVDEPIETSATVYSPPNALGPGRYFWAVTPVDAQNHAGARSGVGSFVWTWPSHTTPRLFDLNEDARVFDPQFAWDPVPGAARYEVEINPSQDFAGGSKVCCAERVIGTSLSPKSVLPNNAYYWRMRAVDPDGQAGQWNYGPPFRKSFDDVTPSVPNLRMRDLAATPTDVDTSTPGLLDTSYPIVQWDPVAGASSYEIQITRHGGVGCDWAAPTWNVKTAATAWTPLASRLQIGATPVPGGPSVSTDGNSAFTSGASYCVRVRAVNEVVSEWTQVGGIGNPAFRYVTPPPGGMDTGPQFTMPNAAYGEPPGGILTTRLPLFTWQPIKDALSYYIVIARDPSFTQVIDVALTNHPMYAPRSGRGIRTYPDETTSYYWAVVPAQEADGGMFFSHPKENFPRPFEKRSTPPTLLTPANGQDVARQVVFRWTATDGAHEYRIQVAADPSFSTPLDDVTTSATSYTSERTYPADTVLYWRARASDVSDTGLTWSNIGTFRRRLQVPSIDPANPTGGETIPVLRWQPVEGATSYDVHVQQADGTRMDFVLRTTALTATRWYGTGIWRWQVRANFPSGTFRDVQGGYSGAQSFTRRIATPTRLRAMNRDRRMLLRWNPARMARSYRVEISTTNSFATVVDRAITDHTAWAPKLLQSELIAGGKFHWRVAAVDEGGNAGAWRTARFKTKRMLLARAYGFVRKRSASVVQVNVEDGRGRGVRKAKVIVKGAGTKRRAKKTNRDGTAKLRVRPKKRGKLKFIVKKRRFRAGRTTLNVY